MEVNWIKYTKNSKLKDGAYLVVMKLFGEKYTIAVEYYANNLYKLDKYDFAHYKGESGWYSYDSEYGHFTLDNIEYYAELPELPDELKDVKKK